MTDHEEHKEVDEAAEALAGSKRIDFPCSNCGAEMSWDPRTDSLSCEYCGHQLKVPREQGTIVERALDEAGEAARGLGLELRVARCSNCGARVTFEGGSTSERCVWCGSAQVLAQEANRNALRPESLVPLDLCRQEASQRFQEWLRGLWFRPNALRSIKRFEGTGVYVPFWTFDARVHSDWSADSGTYYWVTRRHTVMVNGKPQMRTQRVRKTRWRPAWGSRDDRYDDILIPASAGLSSELLGELHGFDTSALLPYRPEYLSGWRAEEYSLDLEQGWDAAQSEIVATQLRRCSADVPGDTQRDLRVRNRITDVRWKHVLLPVWSLQYSFHGETYTVLVNGQSGTVVGKAPLSWTKISLATLAVVAAIVALFLFWR